MEKEKGEKEEKGKKKDKKKSQKRREQSANNQIPNENACWKLLTDLQRYEAKSKR